MDNAMVTTNRPERKNWPKIHLPWAVLVVLLGMLSACSNDDTYLPMLLEDPMASYEAEGIDLIDRDISGYRPQRPFPSAPRVSSVYRVLDEAQAGAILQEVIALAEAGGWEMAPSPTIPNRFEGYKELGVGEGYLYIVTAPDEEAGDHRLHMHLGFSSLDAGDP